MQLSTMQAMELMVHWNHSQEKTSSSNQHKPMVMSAAQDYYEQVLGMGHTPENALAHTRQHYPDFIPGVAEAVAPPVMTPVSQQAVPVAQNVALPGVAAAPAVAAPAAPVAPVAAPAATAPNAYAPLATTPLPGGGTTPHTVNVAGAYVGNDHHHEGVAPCCGRFCEGVLGRGHGSAAMRAALGDGPGALSWPQSGARRGPRTRGGSRP